MRFIPEKGNPIPVCRLFFRVTLWKVKDDGDDIENCIFWLAREDNLLAT